MGKTANECADFQALLHGRYGSAVSSELPKVVYSPSRDLSDLLHALEQEPLESKMRVSIGQADGIFGGFDDWKSSACVCGSGNIARIEARPDKAYVVVDADPQKSFVALFNKPGIVVENSEAKLFLSDGRQAILFYPQSSLLASADYKSRVLQYLGIEGGKLVHIMKRTEFQAMCVEFANVLANKLESPLKAAFPDFTVGDIKLNAVAKAELHGTGHHGYALTDRASIDFEIMKVPGSRADSVRRVCDALLRNIALPCDKLYRYCSRAYKLKCSFLFDLPE